MQQEQPDAERKQDYTTIEVPVHLVERVRAYIEALSQGDDDVEGYAGPTTPKDVSSGEAVGRRVYKPFGLIHESS